MTERDETQAPECSESLSGLEGSDLIKRFEDGDSNRNVALDEMRQRALEFFKHVERRIEDRQIYVCEYRGDGRLFIRFYPNEIFTKGFLYTLCQLKPEVFLATLEPAPSFDPPQILDVVLDVRTLLGGGREIELKRALVQRIIASRMAVRSKIFGIGERWLAYPDVSGLN